MKSLISICIICVISILICEICVAQNVEFNIENFQDRKKEFKQALYEYSIGDKLYIQGKYKDALIYYLKANKFNPDNAKLNLKVGKIYLNSGFKAKSIPFFMMAYKLNSTSTPEIHFYLGQAYQFKTQWAQAIDEYEKYISQLTGSNNNIEKLELARKKIQECESGKQLTKAPVNVNIENIGSIINSEYTDYGAVVSADESILMFTSRRKKTTGRQYDDELKEYYEDIYVSYNKNGKWTKPENIGKPVNTKNHDAIACISPNGQKILIYRDDNKGYGNIYECILVPTKSGSEGGLKGDKWSEPRKLGAHINSPYHESSASLSYDGKTLYFISTRPDNNKGGKDIYMSKWNENKGKWSKAINLGPAINTKYDEEAVFIHSDGKTLYFSSKGHNNIGGYDIFKSVYENGKWSVPENLGYPINTPDDDVFYVVSASGKHAYYASIKEEGLGKRDIYKITFIDASGKQESMPQLAMLKSIINDAITPELTGAKIVETRRVVDVETRHASSLQFSPATSLQSPPATYQSLAPSVGKQTPEIQNLQNSNNKYLISVIIGLLGLGTIITLLSMQQYKLRLRQKTVEMEQELLYSHINPNFIFSSLIAIQSYAFKNNPIEAGKYLSNFANFIRLSFKNSGKEYIPLNKEIKALEHYLTLQQLRFENKFDYNIEVAPNINVETMAIPPMLAQPFIENAIEYGIMHKNNKGRININFNLSGGKNHKILCEIQDNGIAETGQKIKADMRDVETLHATSMLNKKSPPAKTLWRAGRQKIKINTIALIDKNNNAQGTKVVISIPFRNA